ncbi:MAG: hypothetical protein ABJE66_22030 [Deltaproteobacteria bacterium]
MKPYWLALVLAVACGETTSHQLVPPSLDFGKTDCGTTAAARVLVLTNPNHSSLTFDAVLAAGESSMYTVSPSHGNVLAGGALEVTITSKPIPAISAITDNLYGDTLTLTTDLDHDTPHDVAITQTARGAVLQFAQADLELGTGSLAGPATAQAFELQNVGNAATSVTLSATGSSFSVTPDGAQDLAAGASLQGQVSFFAASSGAIAETVNVNATGTVCQAPGRLAVSATGTSGGIAVDVALAAMRGRPGGGDFLGSSALAICVLTKSGNVACTGGNAFGARGAGTAIVGAGTVNLVLTKTGVLDRVVEVRGGRGLFCARRDSGDVLCWGDLRGMGRNNANGSIHDPREFNGFATQVASGASAVGVGYTTECTASSGTGTVACSGPAMSRASHYPYSTWTSDHAVGFAVTGGTGLALLDDGTVMSFGENSSGERGSDVASEGPPSLVAGLTGITQIAMGGGSGTRTNRHACARKSDGTAWCWGRARHGVLGVGNENQSNVPLQVELDSDTMLTGVTAVSAAQAHSCAIASEGVYCWGRNSEGELGSVGASTMFAMPTDPVISNAVKIASVMRSSCAVLATGAVRCWGDIFGPHPGPLSVFEP